MSINFGRGRHSRKLWEPLFCVNKRKTKDEGYKKRKENEELTHSKSILLKKEIILTT
jgi:hypothetical protein